jgi:hypothetical protein
MFCRSLPCLPLLSALTRSACRVFALAYSPGGCRPRPTRAQHQRLWLALSRCSASELQLKYQRLAQLETTETSQEALLRMVYDLSGARVARRGVGWARS